MSYFKKKPVAKKAVTFEVINFEGFTLTVYRSTEYVDGTGGNTGVSLKSGSFALCGFLNLESAEMMIGQNKVLAPVWPSVKSSLIRHGATTEPRQATVTEAAPTETAPAPTETKRKPGRPRRVTASEVAPQAQPAPTPAPTQGMDPATAEAFRAMDAKFKALAEFLMSKSA